MLNARGTESAGEIQQIAVHVKSGSQRRKAVRKVAFVISAVIEELVDCCIDNTIRNLVERADGETPGGAEVVLQPQLSNPGSQVHAGEGLPVTFASRVRRIGRQQYALGTRRRQRSRRRRISEPAGVSVLKQVVVTVVAFDCRTLRRPYITRSCHQLAPELTAVT